MTDTVKEEGSIPDVIPPGFTITRVLSEIPENREQVQFLNNEAKIDSFDVKYRFEELNLFARNGHFRTEEEKKLNYPNEKGMVGGPSGYLVYTNGKAGARVHRELTQWGAHAFKCKCFLFFFLKKRNSFRDCAIRVDTFR